ncbi:MAG: ribosome assembly RNA-binding protein YhbY [Vicinamibacterales bacterium]
MRPTDPRPALALTPRQRKALKARAHVLEPVVQIGQAGTSPAVITEVDRSLTAHGLIKVRLNGADRQSRAELTDALCAETGAVEVQQVGRVLTLWRPRPDDKPVEG